MRARQATIRDVPILDLLVSAPPAPDPIDSIDDWWSRHRAISARHDAPVDAALAGGFAADRLGWAFASGYQAAGRALFPADGEEQPGALCATETGGAHPRAIETRLAPNADGTLRLDGDKTFVTLGGFARRLLVLAGEGDDDQGRKRLRVVRVDATRPGVRVEPRPPAPFVPEVPHAAVRFEGVPVAREDVLPGDGWNDYVKPFRTVEDAHVHAALLGWLIQVGRRSAWPPETIERALALAAAVRTIAIADPRAAATHRALAGLLAASEELLAAIEPQWAHADASTRERWQRDRVLLSVAEKARAARLAAARAATA